MNDKNHWLEPCEESFYYAVKWRRAGRRSLLDLDCGDIERLFAEFELIKVRHTDDCYGETRDGWGWKDQKHYFIEAVKPLDK